MNNKKKIILISNTFNFFNVFMLNHIKHLSYKYALCICCKNAHFLKKKVPKNVLLINVNFIRGISFFNDIIAFFSLLLVFMVHRPNFSISFTPKVGLMVTIVSLITGTPKRFHWFTGQVWANSEGLKRIFFKLTDRLIFYFSHYVLVDGISQKRFLIKEKVISKDKSIVLHMGSVGGVDIKRFKLDIKKRAKLRKKLSITKKTFVFLCLGRINKDKGVVDLINAFKKIEKKHNVLLIFVGPLEDKNLKFITINQKNILHFDYSDKPENWYSLADLLCLPSYREGFGTVIIEAASCCLPALCSKIYGLNDSIIDGKTGFFHKVGIISSIKNKMIFAIKNKRLVKNCGKLARKRIKKDFNQKIITRELMKLINSSI